LSGLSKLTSLALFAAVVGNVPQHIQSLLPAHIESIVPTAQLAQLSGEPQPAADASASTDDRELQDWTKPEKPQAGGAAQLTDDDRRLAAWTGPDAATSPEERQLAAEASPDTVVMANPVVLDILRASKSRGVPKLDAKRYVLAAHQAYAENQAALISVLWGAPAAVLGTACLFLLFGAKGAARYIGGLCNSLSRLWIFLLSIGTALVFLAARVNLWAALPTDVWVVPLAAMLGSAAFLRALDMNYPFWNSSVSALTAPLASCALVLTVDHGAALLHRFSL
jgi:hypothetical protein